MKKLTRPTKPRSIPEIQLLTHILERELPEPAQEYAFHPTRKWRFDIAWPSRKFCVEVEGGVWSHGRHTRGYGFEDDCVKYAEALLLGWTVLRVTPAMIYSLYAIETIQKILMKAA